MTDLDKRSSNPHTGGPPLGPEDSPDAPRLCSRLIRRDPIQLCGRPAVRHVVYWWDADPPVGDPGYDHGFCCVEHWQEFEGRWACPTSHELGSVCGMPGSRLHFDGERSWCTFDELPTAEPARTVAVAETVG